MPEGGGFTYLRSGAARGGEESAPEPAPEVEAEVEAEGDEYPEDGPIPAVKRWVGEDLDRAQEALEQEQTRPGGPRVTLLEHLNDLLADDDNDES